MNSPAWKHVEAEQPASAETIEGLLDAAALANVERRRAELADLRHLVDPLVYQGDLSPTVIDAWLSERSA